MKTPRKFSIPRSFPMPLWLQGSVEVLLAGVFSLALLAVVVGVGWLSLGSPGGLGGVAAASGQLWLAAHGVGLHLDVPAVGNAAAAQGTAHLLPLGLTTIALLFCRRAGARLARASWEGQFWQPVLGGLLAYAVLGAVLALLTGSPMLAAHPVPAAVVPLWVPLVGLMWGGHRVSGSWLRLLGISPEELARRYGQYTRWAGAYLATAVRAVRVATTALLAGGAILFGLAVFWNWNDMVVLNQGLHAGVLGETVLLLLQASLIPNAVLYATSWATGAGFSLGAGTEISPAISHVGGLPSLPLLGTVSPDPGPWAHLVLMIPVLAGALAGWWFVREGEDHLDDWFALRIPVRAVSAALSALCLAALVGLLTGAVVSLLGALAGGSLGVGAWTVLGPDPWRLLAWTWVVVGLGVLLGRLVAPLLEGFRVGSTATRSAEPAASPVRRPRRGSVRAKRRNAAAAAEETGSDDVVAPGVPETDESTEPEAEPVSERVSEPVAAAAPSGSGSSAARPAKESADTAPTSDEALLDTAAPTAGSGTPSGAGSGAEEVSRANETTATSERSDESAGLSALERLRRAKDTGLPPADGPRAGTPGAEEATASSGGATDASDAPEPGSAPETTTSPATAPWAGARSGSHAASDARPDEPAAGRTRQENSAAESPGQPAGSADPGAVADPGERTSEESLQESVDDSRSAEKEPDAQEHSEAEEAPAVSEPAASPRRTRDSVVAERPEETVAESVTEAPEAAKEPEDLEAPEPHRMPEHRPVIARPKRRRRP